MSNRRDRHPDDLALSDEGYRTLFENVDTMVCTLDLEGRFTSLNRAGELLTGCSGEELEGTLAVELIAPELREQAVRQFAVRLSSADDLPPDESVLVTRAGARIPIEVTSRLLSKGGRPFGVLGLVRDISDRQSAENALRRSDERFRALLEAAPDGVVIADAQGRIVLVNAQTEELFGYERGELIGEPVETLLPEAVRSAHRGHRSSYLGDARPRQMGADLDLAGRRKDGTGFPVDISLAPVQTEDGVLVVASVRDVTDRKLKEEELRQSEARFRKAFTFASIGMALVAPDGRFIQVNDSLCELVGYSSAELVAKTFQDITHPDDLEADLEFVRQMLAGEIRSYQMEKRYFHRDGHIVWILLSVSLVRAGDGTPVYFISQIQDITERKSTQEALVESEARLVEAEQRYRTLVEQLPLAVYSRPLEMEAANLYVSPQVERILGYPADEWLTNPDLLSAIVHPDDRERVLADGSRVRGTGEPLTGAEYRYIAPDGRIVWVHDETYVVEDENGKPVCVQGYLLDITERKEAEEERDRLRDELHHAQKLEALGRLAGGVAHDFNNTLTAIRGYSELLLDMLDQQSPARKEAEQIRRAAEHAAALPRQLLAFSRKQVLQPGLVYLDEVVGTALELVRPLVGDSVDVAVTSVGSARVIADASQIEQMVLNLAVNARDAMPDGGRITIGTRPESIDEDRAAEHDVLPGEYAVISVEDTGQGMDPETLARAFEPFFTTKAAGSGSGLGLATAYGTVRQSGGFITLASDVGEGTLVEIHLPSADAAEQRDAVRHALPSTHATVLVVEDEDMVRDVARRALERGGYRVLSAASANDALDAWRETPVDVLVTDMVMPGMGGRELADRILHVSPSTPIVFMSGYTDEAPVVEVNGAAPTFLQKPFSPSMLLDAVGTALGEGEQARRTDAASHNGDGSSSGRRTTCLIADDHPAVLDSVSRFLERHGYDVVARVSRGDDALTELERHQPSLALVDVGMQPLDGVEVARRAAAKAPDSRVVVYTGSHDRDVLRRALDAGARGFVLKETPLAELDRALGVVAAGGTWVDPELAGDVVSAGAEMSPSPLTKREREVLALLADGMTNEVAGSALGISAETVQSHVRNVMGKLDADTRTQAVATAIRQSLIA